VCVKSWPYQREKFPFRENDLSALCSSVVGTPPWVMLWISVRSPLRFQTLSKTQKTDQLPAPPCQMLSYFSCYCRALASTSETGLFSEHVVPSVHLEKMTNCRLFSFLLTRSFVLAVSPLIFLCLFYSYLCLYCICSPVICLSQHQSK